MTYYDDGSNWHRWDGGKCPVHPKSLVEVFCDGLKIGPDLAGSFCWSDGGCGSILAYRVVKEHRVPREAFMDDEGYFWNYYMGAKSHCKGEPVLFIEVIDE